MIGIQIIELGTSTYFEKGGLSKPEFITNEAAFQIRFQKNKSDFVLH
jgi:hypothetical protein